MCTWVTQTQWKKVKCQVCLCFSLSFIVSNRLSETNWSRSYQSQTRFIRQPDGCCRTISQKSFQFTAVRLLHLLNSKHSTHISTFFRNSECLEFNRWITRPIWRHVLVSTMPDATDLTDDPKMNKNRHIYYPKWWRDQVTLPPITVFFVTMIFFAKARWPQQLASGSWILNYICILLTSTYSPVRRHYILIGLNTDISLVQLSISSKARHQQSRAQRPQSSISWYFYRPLFSLVSSRNIDLLFFTRGDANGSCFPSLICDPSLSMGLKRYSVPRLLCTSVFGGRFFAFIPNPNICFSMALAYMTMLSSAFAVFAPGEASYRLLWLKDLVSMLGTKSWLNMLIVIFPSQCN